MDTILFTAYALAYAALLARGLTLAARHGWLRLANVPLLVVAGLVYDNTVIATGRLIGEGALLEGLSVGRFWIHAFLTPLLVLWAWDALSRARVGWARTRAAMVGAIALTVALIAIEVVTVLAGLRVEAEENYGVLSYSDVGGGDGPPLMALVVAAALIVAGFGLVLRPPRWVWLLVGALVMTAGSAVEIPVASDAVTNAFELVLLAAIVATTAHQDRAAQPRPGR